MSESKYRLVLTSPEDGILRVSIRPTRDENRENRLGIETVMSTQIHVLKAPLDILSGYGTNFGHPTRRGAADQSSKLQKAREGSKSRQQVMNPTGRNRHRTIQRRKGTVEPHSNVQEVRHVCTGVARKTLPISTTQPSSQVLSTTTQVTARLTTRYPTICALRN